MRYASLPVLMQTLSHPSRGLVRKPLNLMRILYRRRPFVLGSARHSGLLAYFGMNPKIGVCVAVK